MTDPTTIAFTQTCAGIDFTRNGRPTTRTESSSVQIAESNLKRAQDIQTPTTKCNRARGAESVRISLQRKHSNLRSPKLGWMSDRVSRQRHDYHHDAPMAIYYLGCDASLTHQITSYTDFSGHSITETSFPITGTQQQIDLLIVGPTIKHRLRLAATLSDWNVPPTTLFIVPDQVYTEGLDHMMHHPRVGRSIFYCRADATSVQAGLAQMYAFHLKRESLQLDHSVSGNFTTNNISPRWLFQTMMEHLDEYIYFKDSDSRLLAVSRYMTESCGKNDPAEVIGLRDFDLFEPTHAEAAYNDERKIATGVLKELYQEEQIIKHGQHAWVASRKLPLHTRSNLLAGSFGLSRDITKEKALHQELEKNHERMESELLLARNLQATMMQQRIPTFENATGESALEIATKYIPSFHLSGDFYSIIKTEKGVAVLVADVMGHGVRAAMVTAMIQLAVQQLQQSAHQPAAFMNQLNDMMQRTMMPTGQMIFTTAAYSYLDLETKRLIYVQAGARHGAYVPADSSKATTLFDRNCISPALGLLPDVIYTESTIQMESGDEILLYTDGIIEAAMGEEEFSEHRLIEFLAQHRRDKLSDMMDALLTSVQDFTQSKDLDDDVCLIGLRLA
ncbi:MAG: sigma-B regulation protein RsbU (phosphoserine phosphatase) [Lentimonas sp.]|jgi:sigma-B regulation protein RsbU (phosphoserine phosphatase)